MIEYKLLDTDTAIEYWKKYLWKDLEEIRHVSSMTIERGNNLKVYDLEYSRPQYIGAFDGNRIVGINSGHVVVNRIEYRSRGLYVHPDYRKSGIGQMLLKGVIDLSKEEDCYYSWSFPRKSSLKTYESVGFKKVSDWITKDVDFGPNCYVILDN